MFEQFGALHIKHHVLEPLSGGKLLDWIKPHAWWFDALAAACKIAERYRINPVVPAPEKMTREDMSELKFAIASLDPQTVAHDGIVLVQSQGTADSFVAEIIQKGELVCWFRGTFGCAIKLFGEERSVGGAVVDPTHCRLTVHNRPIAGEPYQIRVEPTAHGGLVVARTEKTPEKISFEVSPVPFTD